MTFFLPSRAKLQVTHSCLGNINSLHQNKKEMVKRAGKRLKVAESLR